MKAWAALEEAWIRGTKMALQPIYVCTIGQLEAVDKEDRKAREQNSGKTKNVRVGIMIITQSSRLLA